MTDHQIETAAEVLAALWPALTDHQLQQLNTLFNPAECGVFSCPDAA